MNMSDDVVCEAEKIGEEGYSARTLTGFTYQLFLCIGLVMALFHIYFLGYSSLEPWILYYTHLGFGLALAYLLYPFSAKSNASRPGAADIGLIVLSVAACAYFIISMNEIVFRIGVSPTPLDLVFSSLVILLVLEMTRRTNGFVLPLIAVLFILYGLYGNILPYSFGGHRGYSFSRLISYLVGMDAVQHKAGNAQIFQLRRHVDEIPMGIRRIWVQPAFAPVRGIAVIPAHAVHGNLGGGQLPRPHMIPESVKPRQGGKALFPHKIHRRTELLQRQGVGGGRLALRRQFGGRPII